MLELWKKSLKKLFEWSRHNSNRTVFLREWRNMKTSHFKTDDVAPFEALERLYERAILLKYQLDDIHRSPHLLLEVLEPQYKIRPSTCLLTDFIATIRLKHSIITAD